jgi:hypothetical protein
MSSDAESSVRDALQRLAQDKTLRLSEVVEAGFASGDGGELTPALWEEIAREADAADRLGLPIRGEVQPSLPGQPTDTPENTQNLPAADARDEGLKTDDALPGRFFASSE